MTATQTNGTGTRERRFSKAFYDANGSEVDGANIRDVALLGVCIDGQLIKLNLEDLSEQAFMRLALDGLYDKITRSVHTAKPKASDTDTAIKVMEETFAQIKSGKFKKGRSGRANGPRSFDDQRFKDAVIAGAKGNGIKASEEKIERFIEAELVKIKAMTGKVRQKYLNEKWMKDPYFKTQWEKPMIERKKAALKKGEVESAFADFG